MLLALLVRPAVRSDARPELLRSELLRSELLRGVGHPRSESPKMGVPLCTSMRAEGRRCVAFSARLV